MAENGRQIWYQRIALETSLGRRGTSAAATENLGKNISEKDICLSLFQFFIFLKDRIGWNDSFRGAIAFLVK